MERAERRKGQREFDNSYELLELIGHGANSIVYKARPFHRGGPSLVALKIISDAEKDPKTAIHRTEREALALLAAQHENVVKLYDYVATEGKCYLALEYLPGGSLASLLDSYDSGLPVDKAIRVTEQLLLALQTLHRAGVIHRDIKPENLLITVSGDIKLSDFGVACIPSVHLSDNDAGTLDYLSPEVLRGELPTPALDLYQTALTFYQLLTGDVPFKGETFQEQIMQKLSGLREPLPVSIGVSRAPFESFFDRALSPEVGRRFHTATEMLEALHAIQIEPPTFSSAGRLKTAGGCETSLTHRVMQSRAGLATRVAHRAQNLLKLIPVVGRSIKDTASPRAMVATFALITAIIGIGVQFIGQNDPAVAALSDDSQPETGLTPRTFAEGLKELFTPSSNDAYETLEPLTHRSYQGKLEKLIDNSTDIEFVTAGIEPGSKFMLILTHKGWTPQVITLSPYAKSKELRVSGSGIQLSLWLAKEANQSNIRGIYKEHVSGREGKWELSATE